MFCIPAALAAQPWPHGTDPYVTSSARLSALIPVPMQHILPAQRLFETPEGMASLLRFLPDDASGQALAATIRARWEAAGLTAAGAAAAASKKAGGAAGAGANAPGALSVARWRMFKEEVEGAVRGWKGGRGHIGHGRVMAVLVTYQAHTLGGACVSLMVPAYAAV